MTDKELWEKSQVWDSSDDGRGKLKILESVEKFAELVRADEPVLQDIEQYRLQMAAICTAAIGYWKEGDGIHPDYDTLALRDVAKLYAKYDALYKAQPEQEPFGYFRYDLRLDAWVQNREGRPGTPFYTAPPQRKPLTPAQAIALWADKSDGPSNSEIVAFARAIEAAHGIKES